MLLSSGSGTTNKITMASNTSVIWTLRIVAVVSALSFLVAVCDFWPLESGASIGRENNEGVKNGWHSKWREISLHDPDEENEESKVKSTFPSSFGSFSTSLGGTVGGNTKRFLRPTQTQPYSIKEEFLKIANGDAYEEEDGGGDRRRLDEG
jgi:hypothetical protein